MAIGMAGLCPVQVYMQYAGGFKAKARCKPVVPSVAKNAPCAIAF